MNQPVDATINLNQNSVNCLKEIKNIGETIYQNVCNGTVTSVPWGTLGWIEFWVTCFALLILGGMTVFLVWLFFNLD